MADPAVLVGVISDQKTVHNVPHRTSCQALGVSEAWFYKWRRRPLEPTKRETRRALLAERVRYFFDRSGQTYGSPRITLDLWEEGWQVSQNTVAEIMAELGLQGRKPPRRRRSLTQPGKRKTAPDLVRRKFDAIAPDVVGARILIHAGQHVCEYSCGSCQSAMTLKAPLVDCWPDRAGSKMVRCCCDCPTWL
ncbi:IS3 family transposase [Streptomyces sp. NPDC001978]|uniref:IS3 family transposase n=1 Tax=Streptomyces sp. NPDC001978 TaxID=3364627 RepID=UPI00369FC09F